MSKYDFSNPKGRQFADGRYKIYEDGRLIELERLADAVERLATECERMVKDKDGSRLPLGVAILRHLGRIADALEAQAAGDPDDYIYSEYTVELYEEARREGWRVYRVMQSEDAGWACPIYVMRRPRQEAPDAH